MSTRSFASPVRNARAGEGVGGEVEPRQGGRWKKFGKCRAWRRRDEICARAGVELRGGGGLVMGDFDRATLPVIEAQYPFRRVLLS